MNKIIKINLFQGQGSQRVGDLKALFKKYP
jgi:hypothetical protein